MTQRGTWPPPLRRARLSQGIWWWPGSGGRPSSSRRSMPSGEHGAGQSSGPAWDSGASRAFRGQQGSSPTVRGRQRERTRRPLSRRSLLRRPLLRSPGLRWSSDRTGGRALRRRLPPVELAWPGSVCVAPAGAGPALSARIRSTSSSPRCSSLGGALPTRRHASGSRPTRHGRSGWRPLRPGAKWVRSSRPTPMWNGSGRPAGWRRRQRGSALATSVTCFGRRRKRPERPGS